MTSHAAPQGWNDDCTDHGRITPDHKVLNGRQKQPWLRLRAPFVKPTIWVLRGNPRRTNPEIFTYMTADANMGIRT